MTPEQIIYNTTYKMYLPIFGEKQSDILAELAVSQSKHETGNYKSKHFRESNNAFGYAYVKGARYQIGAGSIADNKRPVAKYASVADSARELAAWVIRRKQHFVSVSNPQQYAETLKANGYFGDTVRNYVRGLISFFKKMGYEVTIGVVFLLLGLFGLLYLIYTP